MHIASDSHDYGQIILHLPTGFLALLKIVAISSAASAASESSAATALPAGLLAPERYGHFLHLAGQSDMKQTTTVLNAWRAHPEWPRLTVVCYLYCLRKVLIELVDTGDARVRLFLITCHLELVASRNL